MSDDIQAQPENIKISATFSRSVSDGNYGSIKAEAWVQGDVPYGSAPADVTEKATQLLQVASVAVWDQLGLTYTVDEITGLLREDIQAPKVSLASPPSLGGGGGTGGQSGSIRVMNPNDQQGDLPGWLVAACEKDGITAVWDNRAKAAGTKQPHFKEAVARGATGHGKDGEPKAYWPPR